MLSREQMIDMAVAFFEEAYIATGLLPHRGSWQITAMDLLPAR